MLLLLTVFYSVGICTTLASLLVYMAIAMLKEDENPFSSKRERKICFWLIILAVVSMTVTLTIGLIANYSFNVTLHLFSIPTSDLPILN